MRREQAVAVVKELVVNNLIQTDWLSIDNRKADSYELKFRGYCERLLLDTFLQNRNLAMEENKEKGFCSHSLKTRVCTEIHRYELQRLPIQG